MNIIEKLTVEQCYLLMIGFRRNCFYDVANRLGLSKKDSSDCYEQMEKIMGDLYA